VRSAGWQHTGATSFIDVANLHTIFTRMSLIALSLTRATFAGIVIRSNRYGRTVQTGGKPYDHPAGGRSCF